MRDIYLFIKECIPIFLSLFITGLNSIVDYIFTGVYLESKYMAVAGVLVPVFMLVNSVITSLVLSSSSILSKYFGIDDQEFYKTNTLCFLVLIFFTIVMVSSVGLVAPYIVSILNVDEGIIDITIRYCKIYLISYLFYSVSNYMLGLLRVSGKSWIAVRFSIFSVVSNVVFNFFFVSSGELLGIAWATAASCFISLIYLFYSVLRVRVYYTNL